MYLSAALREWQRWHAPWPRWPSLGPPRPPSEFRERVPTASLGGPPSLAGGSGSHDFRAVRGSPVPRRRTVGGVEGSSPRVACESRRRPGPLELEAIPAVCLGSLRHLPELPAPLGIRPETSQETSGQGRCGETGSLCRDRRDRCCPCIRGARGSPENFLCRRRPLPGGRGSRGQ